MSDQENTERGSRHVGVMFGLVVAGAIVLVGGGYALWSWYAAPPPAESRLDLNRIGGSAQSSAQESPAYRELLREHNARGAQEAQRQNVSFIASIPLQQDVIVPPPPITPPTSATVPVTLRGDSQGAPRTQAQDKALTDTRQKALAGLLARLQAPVTESDLPAAEGLGGKEGGWSAWRDSLPGSAVQRAAQRDKRGGAPVTLPMEVVPPYWRGPGEIYTGVDSDNGITPVLGRFTTGPYAGAILAAPEGAKLAGEGVVVHFTAMAWQGQTYTIDAYALQDDSLVANIATDVNHHYVRRILPSILKGIGGIGDLYAQANTQVLSTGFSSVTTRPSSPDGSAVAGVIAGGTASQAAQVLASDAARLPDRTVTVTPGEVVAIQFMRGVYSTDVQPLTGMSGASPLPITVVRGQEKYTNPSPSAAELHADTQARIRAAQHRGESRE